jgi:hypothetical protein
MFGAAEPVYNGYNVMASVDGGYRVTEALWAHGGVGDGISVGRFGQHVPNGGRNGLVRAGVEARWCASLVCGIAGADLGVQHGTFATTVYQQGMQTYTDTALVAIPRIGFDVGGDSVRARVALEADTSLVTTQNNMDYPTPGPGKIIGIELAAGVAYLW